MPAMAARAFRPRSRALGTLRSWIILTCGTHTFMLSKWQRKIAVSQGLNQLRFKAATRGCVCRLRHEWRCKAPGKRRHAGLSNASRRSIAFDDVNAGVFGSAAHAYYLIVAKVALVHHSIRDRGSLRRARLAPKLAAPSIWLRTLSVATTVPASTAVQTFGMYPALASTSTSTTVAT